MDWNSLMEVLGGIMLVLLIFLSIPTACAISIVAGAYHVDKGPDEINFPERALNNIWAFVSGLLVGAIVWALFMRQPWSGGSDYTASQIVPSIIIVLLCLYWLTQQTQWGTSGPLMVAFGITVGFTLAFSIGIGIEDANEPSFWPLASTMIYIGGGLIIGIVAVSFASLRNHRATQETPALPDSSLAQNQE